jgi:transcriptional regulator with XRE-family HTH domain
MSGPARKPTPKEKVFARALLEQRTKLGLTQEQVAVSMSCTPNAVGKVEAGDRLPALAYLPAIAQALDLDGVDLLLLYLQQKEPKVHALLRRRLSRLEKQSRGVGKKRRER